MAYGDIAHVVSRKNEALSKQRDPKKKARRWVVEACHSWFNRFWRLLVRYEKLEHTSLALNHLAAASIALHKINLPVHIIYGQVLSATVPRHQPENLPRTTQPTAHAARVQRHGPRPVDSGPALRAS